jgi:hypothetical protein
MAKPIAAISTMLIPRHFSLASYVRGWSGLRVTFGRFFLNSLLIPQYVLFLSSAC